MALSAAAIAATVYLTHVLFPHGPGKAYTVLIAIFALMARFLDREAGFWALGLSAAAIPYFLLEGEGFAVANPAEALGLVLFVSAGTCVVLVVGGLAQRAAKAEERCTSLQRRDVRRAALLAELSHRIGNDLGALVSLSELQATKAGHAETRDVVSGLADRIHVLGKVYGRLRVSSDRDATLDMRRFLEGLCEDLEATHVGLRPVSIEPRLARVLVPASQAVLVGLVLNEAVTNALKYAFPDDRAGTIAVEFGPDPADPGFACLAVRDDGVGLDGGPAKGTGMGQRLMRGMASQVRGSYALVREGGETVARLRFPIPDAPDGAPEQ